VDIARCEPKVSADHAEGIPTRIDLVFTIDAPVDVPTGELTRLVVAAHAESALVHVDPERGVVFDMPGWFEVEMRVDWDASVTTGTRFSHTKVPGQEPLHSEAINALVLSRISQGKQMLRGNSVFGVDNTMSLILEVWHDAPQAVSVNCGELKLRPLKVPFEPAVELTKP
jgi:hypothetical protein